MSENNDTSNESNSLSSDCVQQQSSRLTLRSGVLRPSVLGPSVLSSASSVKDNADTETNANVSSNYFMKDQLDEDEVEKDAESKNDEATERDSDKDDESDERPGSLNLLRKNGLEGANVFTVAKNSIPRVERSGFVFGQNVHERVVGVPSTSSSSKEAETDNAGAAKVDENADPLSLLRKNGLERANIFAAAKTSMPRVEDSGFIFGQNVHERVVGENISTESLPKLEQSDSGSTSSELLFSSVIQNAVKANESDNTGPKENEAKSLTEVAREYEESRAQKRKFEEVETFTGEENEINIVDINCKLFAFVNSNWEERGRGSLRLNDTKSEQECSRVVFRSSGNLRLLLNTKVWAGMVAERPSQKSLRLTAMDNTGKIKIFLVMSRPVDINHLYKTLVERIDLRKSLHPEECGVAENNGHSVSSEITTHINEEIAQAATSVEPTHTDDLEPSPKKAVLAEN